ncbi:hypothetical protein [Silvimonas sp.]|uniref:hypothetical protein n=1 Tax=Silvimonas sp. TaxID=2650811 RepID=UPI00284488D8|nr:hypothetical protein [Silvimonas sp.]MDR3428175.1 hypothetical protein [Silvimonas sp.]
MNVQLLVNPDVETLRSWQRGTTLEVPALGQSFMLTNDWESARNGDQPGTYRVGEAWLSRDTQYLPRLNFKVAEPIATPVRRTSPPGFISGVYWHSAKEAIQVRRDGFRAFPPARRKQTMSIAEPGKITIHTRHPRTLEAINRLAERIGLSEQALLLDALYAGLGQIASSRLDTAKAEAFLKAFSVTQVVDKAVDETGQDLFARL